MAYRVRLTPRAADDIDRIHRRVSQESQIAGQKWFNRLIDKIYSLGTLPERCGIVESLSRPDRVVRKLLFGHRPHLYRIYFDIVGETVRVLHIRHAARREPKGKG
jgi:plasmid stabilization system protein ParE